MAPTAMKWREYHESTKHIVGSLKQAREGLDWANMPDPFRHYEGAPVLDLLGGAFGSTPAIDGSTFLSQILFYSA